MLDFITRRKIQRSLKKSIRGYKRRLFKEVAVCLETCDRCPLKGKAVPEIPKEDPRSYESICGSCENYRKMRKLGHCLWNRELTVEFLLSKGANLTADEVLYLVEIGAKKKEIQEALGFQNVKQLNDYIEHLGKERKVAR